MTWLVAVAWAGNAEHDAAFQVSRDAEQAGHYEEAVRSCALAITLAPTGPRAATCERRVAFLERRRDTDGTFAGWTALQSVREQFRTMEAVAARSEVARIASAPTTSDVVRAETAVWLARDALTRGDPAAALTAAERVRDLALPDDRPVATQVGELRAMALARLGRDEEAGAVEATVRVRVDPSAARPTPVELIWRDRRRQNLAWASSAAIAGFGLLAAPLATRGLRSGWFSPLGLLPIGLAAASTAGLVYLRAPEVVATLGWMVAAFVVVHLLSAAALRGARSVAVAAVVRIASVLATFGAAYLALWYTGTLSWVGA